jgi:NADH-quinone oxidoreductase subunit C
VDPERLAERLRQKERFPAAHVARGEVTLTIDRSELLAILGHLSTEPTLSFDFLSDVSATDWPDRVPRYWMAYHLFSMEHHHRLRVKLGLEADDATVPTVTGLFPTANWLEREVYDFFGIGFEGHPDLRRILMPDDWDGYPLRKDYELGGVGTRYKGAFIPPVDQRE